MARTSATVLSGRRDSRTRISKRAPPGVGQIAGPIQSPGSVLSCRLKVTLPEGHWLQIFTAAHPQLRLEVENRLEVGERATMLEVAIRGSEGGDWSEEIKRLPGVEEVDVISSSEGYQACRVVAQGRGFLPLFKELKLMRHFPFPIQDGVATWTVIGPGPKVRAMLKSLEVKGARFQVEAVVHGAGKKGEDLLTPRQREVLRRAMAEGYFDVPRRISLTELATRMGIAISTLSVTLAVIERKILEPHA